MTHSSPQAHDYQNPDHTRSFTRRKRRLQAVRQGFPSTVVYDDVDVIRAGGKVPVWSDALSEWLWWARDEEARQQLLSEGCEVVIYTLGELELVAGWDATALRDVHTMKRTLGESSKPPL